MTCLSIKWSKCNKIKLFDAITLNSFFDNESVMVVGLSSDYFFAFLLNHKQKLYTSWNLKKITLHVFRLVCYFSRRVKNFCDPVMDTMHSMCLNCASKKSNDEENWRSWKNETKHEIDWKCFYNESIVLNTWKYCFYFKNFKWEPQRSTI